MPNPRAQQPLSFEQIIKDAKSLGVPAQALLDALAGGVKGSVSATVGAPADIYNLLNQASFRGQLPTMPYGSEDISKMLPDVISTGDKSRQHSAEYGENMGSFIPTPMAGQALKGAVKLGKAGAKALGEEAGRRAVMGESFTPFVNTAIPQTHVVKPEKGGNWLASNVEKTLESLKQSDLLNNVKYFHGPEFEKAREARIKQLKESGSEGALRVAKILEENIEPDKAKGALNQWVDKNLTNYVKKEMATPEDPVRKLAEQGVVHFPIAEDPTYWQRKGDQSREAFGGKQLSQSDLAKQWENRTDSAINVETAQQHQDMMHLAPGLYTSSEDWIKKLSPETLLYNTRGSNFNPSDLGFTHIMDVLKQDLENNRLRPESLKNVSMEQAVRRTHEYDQEMAKKMAEAQIKATEGMPVHKEYPEGYKWIELAMPKKPKEVGMPKGYQVSEMDYGNGDVRYFAETPTTRSSAFKTREEAEADLNNSVQSLKGFRENLHDPKDIKRLEDALKYEGETMGHCVGGYCPDVLEGRSRIFSLRDTKGEPHVTVETGKGDFSKAFDNLSQEEEDAIRKVAPSWASDEELLSAMKQVFPEKANIPETIVQIKGKQNLAPKEQYLPFVQDFVKSGNWSDVGDLHHTDLTKIYPESDLAKSLAQKGMNVPSYATSEELTNLLKQAEVGSYRDASKGKTWINDEHPDYRNDVPPVEGMKKGGVVSISDNPDTMYMELMDRKLAKGGAVLSLETNLPALPKTDYHSIDELMAHISKEHKIPPQKLHDDFVAKHHMTPDTWIKRK